MFLKHENLVWFIAAKLWFGRSILLKFITHMFGAYKFQLFVSKKVPNDFYGGAQNIVCVVGHKIKIKLENLSQQKFYVSS